MEDIPTKSISYNTVKKFKNKNIKQDEPIRERNKKRVATEKWNFSIKLYEYQLQIQMIKDIYSNHYNYNDEVSKIAIQQLNRKIYGYKQQDIIKKHFNDKEFITFQSVINKMIECELKCYYCSTEMSVLYDISREMKQWTVDRIDNDVGHNLSNYYLSCLECNLKRRRRSDDKFLFTKKMKLVKLPRENNVDSSLV